MKLGGHVEGITRREFLKLARGVVSLAVWALAGCRAVLEGVVSTPSATSAVALSTRTSTPLPRPTVTHTASPALALPTEQPTATSTASPTFVPPTQQPTLTHTASPTLVPPTQRPTATSTASPSPEPPTPRPTAVARGDPDGAVQVILDYWAAIDARDYPRAYRFWANDGAASGRSLEQFADGFADTVHVSVLMGAFGELSSTTGRVTLPVTLLAVANDPETSEQYLQHYQGTYTLQFSAGAWRIASASIRALPAGTPAPAYVQDPLVLLGTYFESINRREYARAYTCWRDPGQALRQSYSRFRQGFATTKRVDIQMGEPQLEGAAGSSYAEVPVLIVATQTNGTTRAYCGSYVLRRANVTPFDQFGWRIERADIASIALVKLNSPEAERLLRRRCRP